MAKKTLSEMELSLTDSKARGRLAALFDEDSFVETGKFISAEGEVASVVTGYGLIDGAPAYAFSQDISIRGGAVDKTAAMKLSKLYDLAVKNGAPVVGIYDSKGGDVSDNAALLKAYAEIADASARLSGVVPQIALVAGLCAGTAAMTACMADFVVMTEETEFFMTPPFVAEDGGLNGAGTAKNAALSGTAAIVAKDEKAAIAEVKKLVRILPSNNLELSGNDFYAENDAEITDALSGAPLVAALADKESLTELYADFGAAAYTALGSLSWRTVGFIATDKNGEKLTPEDNAKIARFLSFCDAFSIPVVTVLNSEGFSGGAAKELSGSIRDAAKLAQLYASATTPKVTLITAKAYGTAYCAIAPASDFVIAYEDAVISAVAPKTAVVFLKGDELNGSNEAALTAEYAENEASAFALIKKGGVDRAIEAYEARDAILSAVEMLSGKRVDSPKRKHINFVY
ncbi:MAG: hypothetical protein NC084_03255 [Bacteroides sp.]|nr:acetyl-CoA carboxylase [Eubacterium sp.]MCM1417575.1 acetyl-CoA carboxylase [Roseburia sp.]MCM1461714.1 hypothetical protein [Bacteroides sp.]